MERRSDPSRLTAVGVTGAFLSGSLPGRQARTGGRRNAPAVGDGAAGREAEIASARGGDLARVRLGALRGLRSRS